MLYKQHGQHLNLFGREQIAMKLVAVIAEFLNMKKGPSTCLPWIESTKALYHEGNIDDLDSCIIGIGLKELPSVVNISSNKEGMGTYPQPVKRQRKPPAQRNQDFLWT